MRSLVTPATYVLLVLVVAMILLLSVYTDIRRISRIPTSALSVWRHERYQSESVGGSAADVRGEASPSDDRVVESRQKARKRLLKEVCERYHRFNSSSGLLQRRDRAAASRASHFILVNERYRTLYCTIPKTGCTNWRRILAVLANITSTRDYLHIPQDDVHEKIHIPRLEAYPMRARTYMLENYYKFLFVREPFGRLVSAFRDKFVENYPNKYFHQFYNQILQNRRLKRGNATVTSSGGNMSEANFTFSEFVEMLTQSRYDSAGFHYEPHWERYYRLCEPCLIDWDFIGHLESVEADSRAVLSQMNVSSSLIDGFPDSESTGYRSHSTPGNRQDRRSGEGSLSEDYSHITREQVELLREIYGLDFDMFGYDMEFIQGT